MLAVGSTDAQRGTVASGEEGREAGGPKGWRESYSRRVEPHLRAAEFAPESMTLRIAASSGNSGIIMQQSRRAMAERIQNLLAVTPSLGGGRHQAVPPDDGMQADLDKLIQNGDPKK